MRATPEVLFLTAGIATCALLAPGCGGDASTKDAPPGSPDAPAAGDPPARPRPRAVDPGELVAACSEHLLLLHRRRLAHELGPDLAKLAGPVPTLGDIDSSLARLRSDGIDGLDRELVGPGTFATIADSAVEKAGFAFIAWTPVLDDVGLAKIAERRPGTFRTLWGKTLTYELLVLDGFKVPDFPRFREETLEHKEGGSDLPRRRGSLLVIDKAALAVDAKRIKDDTKPERADLRALAERLGPDGLLKEVELREAAYLRFQDELREPSKLDRATTWLEVLEGEPDLAFAGGAIGAGDRPEERRRASGLPSLFLELSRGGALKEDMSVILKLPAAERSKKLKELAPQLIARELEK